MLFKKVKPSWKQAGYFPSRLQRTHAADSRKSQPSPFCSASPNFGGLRPQEKCEAFCSASNTICSVCTTASHVLPGAAVVHGYVQLRQHLNRIGHGTLQTAVRCRTVLTQHDILSRSSGSTPGQNTCVYQPILSPYRFSNRSCKISGER